MSEARRHGGRWKLRCDVCHGWRTTLLGAGPHICNDCFERLDQLDRDHLRPAFRFATGIVRNREAARAEGVQ